MTSKELTIWTIDSPTAGKAALPSLSKPAAQSVTISTDTLMESLQEFMLSIDGLTKIDTPNESEFQIDELELTLAVNAKGGIELIGKIEAGAQAGIKIKLKRKKS